MLFCITPVSTGGGVVPGDQEAFHHCLWNTEGVESFKILSQGHTKG